jgi:hypothetical protein
LSLSARTWQAALADLEVRAIVRREKLSHADIDIRSEAS